MFLAALMSRWCSSLHSEQTHSLIPRPVLPFGLLSGITPQLEQVWVERREAPELHLDTKLNNGDILRMNRYEPAVEGLLTGASVDFPVVCSERRVYNSSHHLMDSS